MNGCAVAGLLKGVGSQVLLQTVELVPWRALIKSSKECPPEFFRERSRLETGRRQPCRFCRNFALKGNSAMLLH